MQHGQSGLDLEKWQAGCHVDALESKVRADRVGQAGPLCEYVRVFNCCTEPALAAAIPIVNILRPVGTMGLACLAVCYGWEGGIAASW